MITPELNSRKLMKCLVQIISMPTTSRYGKIFCRNMTYFTFRVLMFSILFYIKIFIIDGSLTLHFQGANDRYTYVAAQGPLPNTVKDFWRMLWETDTKIILMACNEFEGDPPKVIINVLS